MKSIIVTAIEAVMASGTGAMCKTHTAIRNPTLTAILAMTVAVGLLVAAPVASAHTYSSGLPGGPAIVLPNCLLAGGEPANAPIDITFVTAPDTSVDLASLHVWVHTLLGWVDATNRLLSRPGVHVTAHSIHLDGGVLPAGKHQVRISFHDQRGQIVEATGTILILRSPATIQAITR
jgi:hypothetical protein